MRISEINKVDTRATAQKGNFKGKEAYGIRKELQKVVSKHAKGDNFKIITGKYPADLGLYYTGNNGSEAFPVGQEVLGSLYDYFQGGTMKTRTRVKKVQDNADIIKYSVIPTHDPRMTHETPASQISFWMNKAINSDIALVGISIETNFN